MRKRAQKKHVPVVGEIAKNFDTKGNSMNINWDNLRLGRASRGKADNCLESMKSICMKEKKPEDVKCCLCGQKTLRLNRHADGANPWAKIQCTYVYPDKVACGFQHTCGHSEPPPPVLTHKIKVM